MEKISVSKMKETLSIFFIFFSFVSDLEKGMSRGFSI